MSEGPNWYSTSADFTLTTGGSQKKTLGFAAGLVRLLNTGSTFLYANLRGSAATTNDLEIRNGSELLLQSLRFPIAEISLFHPNFSTTSTGDAMSVNLSAASA